MTFNQLKRFLNKETFDELHSKKYKVTLMEKKTLLEANNKKKMINFYQGKFFSSCQFAIQTYKLSMNCVNLCKLVASFPGVLAVSPTWICYKNLGKKVQLICLCSQFFFLPLLSCTLQCASDLESLLSPGSHPMTI